MKKKELLLKKPVRTSDKNIKWESENEIIIIIYPKNFGKIEKWLHDRIGGPEVVRRPLDRYTSHIWKLCDGENSILDIITEFDKKFGEEVAPAIDRVQLFLEKLLELRLITIK
tara:strand:- start:825 stop:1163 length:339 start_codon:yes stop_codon:yes gene_type:complete